jgi:hypothetical protein
MKHFILLSLLFAAVSVASAQEGCPYPLWSRMYTPGNSWSTLAMDFVVLEDGGVLMCGLSVSVSRAQVWVSRTDSLGNPVWSYEYGDPDQYDWVYAITDTRDGNFVMAGVRGWRTAGELPRDSAVVYVLKINADGDTLWTRMYSKVGPMAAWDIVEADNGDLAICGETSFYDSFLWGDYNPAADSADAFLLLLTADGDSLGFHTYGGSLGDEAFCMHQSLNGGYVLAGTTASYGDSEGDAYVVWTDAAGNELQSRTYGSQDPHNIESICALDMTSDGGFILTGEYADWDGGQTYLLRIDSSGQKLWEERYRSGANSRGHSLTVLPGDSFVVAGDRNTAFMVEDISVLRGDGSGYITADCPYSIYFDDSGYYAAAMRVDELGRCTVSGIVEAPAGNRSAAFLLRTRDIFDDVPIPSGPLPQQYVVSVFPNPFNSATTLRLSVPMAGDASVGVFDVLGRQVLTLYDGALSPGEHAFEIDGTSLASGLYFVRTQASTFRDCQKIVLMK